MASRVGKYLLFETLGEGAFGKVKLGVHEETGEQVAVKIMDKSDIRAQEMTMNVRREIAIMKALKHRNIVNLRQVLTSQSKLYIVMELVTGGELFTKILKEGKLEERVARRYFQQLVDGIDYCHMRGVCHRDLKPENLLIDETTGELKITDFGLSAMKGASTTTDLLHTQCGSPNYCAPEIIARHKQGYSGAKVDAWSCGIILFALLAGYLPFYDENTKALYRSIQKDEAKFPKKFPPEAKDLVIRLLHKEPEERITLMEVKKHPWFAVDYEGDGTRDAVPKKRGHRRKPSMDHAPRSRDLGTRKKSDKSDTDSAVHSTTSMPPPVPPPVVQPQTPPLPPPVVPPMQRPPPPPVHRPPGPPPVTTPGLHPLPPRGQIPPQPAYPPTSMEVPASIAPPPVIPPPVIPSSSPRAQRPGPISPIPPPVTHYAPARQAPVNSLPQGRSNPTSPMPPNVDAYDSQGRPIQMQDNISISPPLIIDPMQPGMSRPYDTGRKSSNLSASNPVTNHMNNTGAPIFQHPNGYYSPAPPVVPQPIPQTVPQTIPTVVHQVVPQPAPPTIPQNVNQSIPVVVPQMIPQEPPAIPTNIIAGIPPNTAHIAPKMTTSPKPSRPKWTVAGPTYGRSTLSSETHVITPSSLANGDTSWMKFGRNRESDHSTSKEPVEKKPIIPEPKMVPEKPALPKVSALEELETELSTVERRRMLFNKLATKSDMPPPAPDLSHTVKSDSVKNLDVGPESPIVPRFEDRPEAASIPRYPTAEVSDTNSNGVSSNSKIFSNSTHSSTGGSTEQKPSFSYTPPEDDDTHIPLRQRLDAAVARYRRIFRLSNSIGITSSPSFSSNKGPMPTSHDDDPKGSRSDFFARAKAVTGAWGIILTQELEEDSDSEDELAQVTEAELQAFSKLLDFWDNRRASATITNGGEVMLDDEKSSPLTEEDIQGIQSLLQKLEPKQVEDEVEEVATEVEPVVGDTGSNGISAVDPPLSSINNSIGPTYNVSQGATSSLPYDVGNGVYPVPTAGGTTVTQTDTMPVRAPPLPTITEFSDITTSEVSTSAQSAPPRSVHVSYERPLVPSIPPVAVAPPPPPPPPPAIPTPAVVPQAAVRTAPPPPPPPPPAAPIPQATSTPRNAPPPPTPPAYAAPAETAVDPANRRMAVTPSTVRDPYRPQAPPSYAPPNPVQVETKDEGATGQLKKDSGASSDKPPKGSPRDSNDIGKKISRRSSSTNKSDADIKPSKNLSRDSGPMLSAASGASDGSGSGSRRHTRTPSRDDHATFGLFRFGILGKRRSSSMTTFESQLVPEKCMLELARVLDGMKCKVMLKKDESKMKCETTLKGEKLLVSISCSRDKKITTVQFKKGRKDKSNIDAKDFFEFFQLVHSRFAQRTGSVS